MMRSSKGCARWVNPENEAMNTKTGEANMLWKISGVAILLITAGKAMAVSMQTTPEKAAQVTFNKDVLPILQKNCQSCHRPGQIAPMSFLTYQDARPWAKAMKAAVVTKKMPPWFADPQFGHF